VSGRPLQEALAAQDRLRLPAHEEINDCSENC
jgi:hypothetical protein